jgi:tetratricopeptide (TPR) repeat protein
MRESSGKADGPDDVPQEDTHSKLSGSAHDVVQARDVSGGIHFHASRPAIRHVPRQLPSDIHGFVNRIEEIGKLDAVLTREGPVSGPASTCVIVGTAGVGKTSLAVHWAHRIHDRFPDGQLYVNLRGYDPGEPIAPEQVLDRFLRTLGVRPGSIPADLDTRADLYRSLLAERRVLVILDNAVTVRQVRPLLVGASGCLVLVTSRSRLSGLVARDGAHRLTIDILPEPEAVELLQAVIGEYRAGDNADEVAELAHLCARLPLALRIAAERAASRPRMPLAELITDLRDESALWDALSSEDDEEADAVRTVFAWSYRALSEQAARLFRLLGLQPGPDFSALAAAALAGTSFAQVRGTLDVLVGAHLLEQTAADRYQFHDLLRAYAIDQVHHDETTENEHAALERILTWYLHSAAAATVGTSSQRRLSLDPPGPDIKPLSFADYDEAFSWHELERANLLEAARTAARAGFNRIAWQLPATLQEVFGLANRFDAWFPAAQIGLDASRRANDRYGEAESLYSLGMAYTRSHRLAQAAEHYNDALAIRRDIGDKLGEVASLNGIGAMNWRGHRLREAFSYFEQTLSLAREIGELGWEATAVLNLARINIELGNLQEAINLLELALLDQQELGNLDIKLFRSRLLAVVQRELGNFEEALSLLDHALAESRVSHHRVREGLALTELAKTQHASGQFAQSLVSYQLSVSVHRDIGDRSREARALDGTGEVYASLERFDEAVDFHRRAAATHRDLNEHWWLAVSLDNLATAVHRSGFWDKAQPHWLEALTLFSEFGDPKALDAHNRIRQVLEAYPDL